MDFAPAPARGEGGRRAGPICGPPPTNPRGMKRRSPTVGRLGANPQGHQAPSFREGCCLTKCAARARPGQRATAAPEAALCHLEIVDTGDVLHDTHARMGPFVLRALIRPCCEPRCQKEATSPRQLPETVM